MKLIHSILMSFCCLTFVTSCSEKQQKQTQLPSVKVDTVIANGEKSFLQYPGRVKAAQDIDMAFRVSGTIEKFYVKEGVSVKAGQLLAEMDPSDYQVQLAAFIESYFYVCA